MEEALIMEGSKCPRYNTGSYERPLQRCYRDLATSYGTQTFVDPVAGLNWSRGASQTELTRGFPTDLIGTDHESRSSPLSGSECQVPY
jgi:hypothetical protein